MKIVLASASPRRKEILNNILKDFVVIPTATKEVLYGKPSFAVIRTAKEKALPLFGKYDVIISADTTVYHKGEFIGKPHDKNDARRILSSLSNTTHYVYTGVCILYKNKIHTFYDKSAVVFRKLSQQDIDNYILNCNPMDKAGAYGIQDSDFVKKYVGSFDNIVGLPSEKLIKKLTSLGILEE